MRRRRFKPNVWALPGSRRGTFNALNLAPLCRREVGGGGERISSATWPRGFTNFGVNHGEKAKRSCETNTCPSQPAPEPIPIVEIASRFEIVSATSGTTNSSSSAKRTGRLHGECIQQQRLRLLGRLALFFGSRLRFLRSAASCLMCAITGMPAL